MTLFCQGGLCCPWWLLLNQPKVWWVFTNHMQRLGCLESVWHAMDTMQMLHVTRIRPFITICLCWFRQLYGGSCFPCLLLLGKTNTQLIYMNPTQSLDSLELWSTVVHRIVSGHVSLIVQNWCETIKIGRSSLSSGNICLPVSNWGVVPLPGDSHQTRQSCTESCKITIWFTHSLYKLTFWNFYGNVCTVQYHSILKHCDIVGLGRSLLSTATAVCQDKG